MEFFLYYKINKHKVNKVKTDIYSVEGSKMKIDTKIDNSSLRKAAYKKNMPIVELLVGKLDNLALKQNQKSTLLAVCPNSENVLKAALRSAKRANCPIKFAATLNQVDIDRSYTG